MLQCGRLPSAMETRRKPKKQQPPERPADETIVISPCRDHTHNLQTHPLPPDGLRREEPCCFSPAAKAQRLESRVALRHSWTLFRARALKPNN